MESHFILITGFISVFSTTNSLVLNTSNVTTEPIQINKTADPDTLKIGPETLSMEGCPDQLDNKIKSVEDLHKHYRDLNCIFHWGVTPWRVPIGIWQGSVLSVLSQKFTNPLLDLAWTDKLIYEQDCDGLLLDYKVYRGVTHIAKVPVPGFLVYIADLKDFNPVDYDDGKRALIVDYNQSYKDPCDFNSETTSNHLLDVPLMYHALRIVGQTKNKGTIYLGKAYIINRVLGQKVPTLWAWFAVVNYGNPDIIVPDELLEVPIGGAGIEIEGERNHDKLNNITIIKN